jgi:hypothetical protein
MADNKATKSAGEHWVCSVLSRQGWGAALTRDGLERTDILAVDPTADPRHTIEVQVKTCTNTTERYGSWVLGEKAQTPARSEDEWFVLVALDPKTTDRPRSFVMPRNHVAAAAYIRHMHWRTEPGVPKGKRNGSLNTARIQIWVAKGYEDRWDILKQPASRAPVLLPPEFRDYALSKRVGLPKDHPWRTDLPDW